MRAFTFVFSFLFLIQLNAAALCSAYCEATKVPPCHQPSEDQSKSLDKMLSHSCCEDVSPCNVIDEQSSLFVVEKNHSHKKIEFNSLNTYQVSKSEGAIFVRAFVVTHYTLNGPPLYLLYSQLKIPNAA